MESGQTMIVPSSVLPIVGIAHAEKVLAGLELVAVEVMESFSDGKINIADIPHLLSLVKNYQVLIDAFNSVKDVPAEIKAINVEDIQKLGADVIAMVGRIAAVRKIV